ncbi:cupredoxin domain-containing protein [Antrihabitans cavernicola]|uniref:Copper-binding protein n=1 Tax=Antrihabitans cavernicola TaxID=2495913 RepID=A0A5A7SBQ7_9NOCA|nr:cupredoxin family copper-binding protein [Spelaeibacter cavernicola]KAA0022759.1 copper-binding protein [Spelaeibacter cavernicola]
MTTPARARSTHFGRTRLVVAGIAVAAALSACGSSDSSGVAAISTTPAPGAPTTAQVQSGDVAVKVKGMAFTPATITVTAGTKVTWTFDDGGIPHTVTGLKDAAMGINSPILKEGDYSYTFDKPGTYNYICSIHPDMKGTVTVR